MKRERYRERYFKGYVMEKTPTDREGKYKTEYVYHGNYYYWKADQLTIRRLKRLFPVMLLADASVFFTALVMDTAVNRVPVVIGVVLLSLIPLVYEAIGVVQFCMTKERVREFEFDEINLKLRYAPLIRGAILAVSAPLALIWGLVTKGGSSFSFAAFCLAFSAGCCFVIWSEHRRLRPVLTEEGDYGDIEDETYSEQNMPVPRKKRKSSPGGEGKAEE